MPKHKYNHGGIMHSLPSFNKSDRLSVKVASLRLAEHMSDPDKIGQGSRDDPVVDRRRNNPHRRTLGGRGREWAAESLKLLEALLELEDSQPIKEPVNPLKFPDYYSQILNPLDLSKIMLKFHGGSYESLDVFAKDMRAMFSNYKGFFKDANGEIYTQVHRLSWWFETELERITEKWGRKYNTMSLSKTPKPVSEAATSQDADSAKDGPALPQDYPTADLGVPRPTGTPPDIRRKRKRLREADIRGSPEPSGLLGSIRQQVCHESDLTEERLPLAMNLSRHPPPPPPPPKDHRARTGILSHSRAPKETFPAPLARLKPGTLAQLKGLPQSRLSAPNADQPFISPQLDTVETPESARQAPPERTRSWTRTPRIDVDVLTLELNVSNIWFGAIRIKPKKQAMLSETGLQVSLFYSDVETPFTIHSEEIVRCVAHFGRSSQKHTLFIFVLPSCSKRLEALNEKYVNTSMIVIFLNLAKPSSISTLVHIFWNIGRRSLFGPVFSEVDQQGALMLLGNIKPGILSRVTNKYKNSTAAAASQDASEAETVARKKRKEEIINQITELQTTSDPSTSSSPQIEKEPETMNISNDEPESSVMPDSSMSSTNDPEPGTSSATEADPSAPKHFEKDFAERLGASLQQGFKEGFTEVLKNLADTLYGKGKPPSGKEGDLEQVEAKMGDDESDIEIVIPTDSEDEDSKKAVTPQEPSTSAVGVEEEEELAVTGEKLSIRCPITQQIMIHPTKNKHCGHCYDRQGVEELIKNRKEKARCPVAGCSNLIPLNMSDMVYEYNLWKHIQETIKSPLFKPEEN